MKEMNRSREAVARFRLIRNCMFLSGLSVFAQLYLFQPMLSEMCRNFGVSPAESSLSVSASTAGMALGLIVMAFKADSVSRERLMGASLLLSSLLTIVSAFTDSYFLLLVLNLLKGMVLAGVSSVALAYLSEEVDKSMIGLAISLYLSGNTLGGMSGRVAVGRVAYRHCQPAAGRIVLLEDSCREKFLRSIRFFPGKTVSDAFSFDSEHISFDVSHRRSFDGNFCEYLQLSVFLAGGTSFFIATSLGGTDFHHVCGRNHRFGRGRRSFGQV